MAKKAKAKKAKAQPKKKVARKAAGTRQSAAKRKGPARQAPKRPAPSRTTAAKTKVAARAAASRNDDKPQPPPSRLASAAKVAAGVALLAMDGVLKRLPWARNENDPIALLESDHRHFEKLLDEGGKTTERAKKGRREILDALTRDLNVHEALEEQVFYPALSPHAAAHDLVLESYQEHHVADQIVKELHQLEKDDEKWGAKFKVLKENVAHHISEEENKLFPVARGLLEKEELLALGAKMRALRRELER
jgi:iron-sulfur cluster repair protein YtfE (RIC family)